MKKLFVCFAGLTLAMSANVFSQEKSNPVLMTIGGEKITKDEFLSVYRKNNSKEKEGTTSKKSLEDYLDLYTIFRLKVKDAKDMGLDTTKSFRDELGGYRRTLAQPYMMQKNVIDSLSKEAYDRMHWNLRTSQILVRFENDPSPADTLEAYTRICLIRDFIKGKLLPANVKKHEAMVVANLKLTKHSPPKDTALAYIELHPIKEMLKLRSHDFASVAKVTSEHASKSHGGDIGYLTGLMSQGYPYRYESAAYNAKPGEVYGPIRTDIGYHLIIVTDKQPHTEIHTEHLMLIFKRGMTKADSMNLKHRIDSIYNVINQGQNFEELTQKLSEHRESARLGGDLGWVSRTSNFPQDFKEAVFKLTKDGQISKPIETSYGWHIIKRVGSRGLAPFDSLKADLKVKVQQDDRNNVAKQLFIASIKKQYGFKELCNKCYTDFYPVIDSSYAVGQWSIAKAKNLNKPMFSLKGKAYTEQSFAKYLEKNYRMVGQIAPNRIVDAMYTPFVNEECLTAKEDNLENEYPDFKSLVQEYYDGILLFNLTDQKVWSKAIKDTTGAKEYYEKNKDHFMWDERLDASIYSCASDKVVDQLKKLLKKKKTDKEIIADINKDSTLNIMVEPKTLYLKGDNAMLDATGWKPGITNVKMINGKRTIADIRKVLKPTPKTFAEARGLVTSDYQTWLEKQWIETLKTKYPVSVDKKVLDSIQ